MKVKVVPERIRERLIALGKDPEGGGQSWLAREVGMKPQGIQSILAGDVDRPRKLMEIADALETTQEYLLGQPAKASASASSDLAIELADLLADLLRTKDVDLQNQVAKFIEKRVAPYRQRQSRHTATKQPS